MRSGLSPNRGIVLPQHLVNRSSLIPREGDPLQLVQMVWKSKYYPDHLYVRETGGIMPSPAGVDGHPEGNNPVMCQCIRCGLLFTAWVDPEEDTEHWTDLTTEHCQTCSYTLWPTCEGCGWRRMCECDSE